MTTPTPETHPPKAKSIDDQPKADIPQYARVVGLTYLGMQPEWEWQGKKQEAVEQFEITYELPNSKMKDGRPHWLSESMAISFNDGDGNPQYRSRLMKRIAAICPGGEAEGGFNMPAILNQICMVTPHHDKKGYARLAANAVVGVPVGTSVPELQNPMFDMSDWDKVTKEQWDNLKSPLTRKKIQAAENYPVSALKSIVEGVPAINPDEDVPF